MVKVNPSVARDLEVVLHDLHPLQTRVGDDILVDHTPRDNVAQNPRTLEHQGVVAPGFGPFQVLIVVDRGVVISRLVLELDFGDIDLYPAPVVPAVSLPVRRRNRHVFQLRVFLQDDDHRLENVRVQVSARNLFTQRRAHRSTRARRLDNRIANSTLGKVFKHLIRLPTVFVSPARYIGFGFNRTAVGEEVKTVRRNQEIRNLVEGVLAARDITHVVVRINIVDSWTLATENIEVAFGRFSVVKRRDSTVSPGVTPEPLKGNFVLFGPTLGVPASLGFLVFYTFFDRFHLVDRRAQKLLRIGNPTQSTLRPGFVATTARFAGT